VKTKALAAAICGWIAVVVGGLCALTHYKSIPGGAGHPPAAWPRGTAVIRGPDRGAAIMFMHPQCDCSRASLSSFGELISRAAVTAGAPRTPGGGSDVSVVFVRPPGTNPGWEQTSTYQRARSFPGVNVMVDEGGREAARFEVQTSGHVLVYDASGKLTYSGGITASRGHEGPSRGLALAGESVFGRPRIGASAPVFGCSFTPDRVSP
jgi:hypothetical protein